MNKTYNQYLTEGIQDGSIKEHTRDGVRCYGVRRPHPDEEVVGYVSFSGFLAEATATELANG